MCQNTQSMPEHIPLPITPNNPKSRAINTDYNPPVTRWWRWSNLLLLIIPVLATNSIHIHSSCGMLEAANDLSCRELHFSASELEWDIAAWGTEELKKKKKGKIDAWRKRQKGEDKQLLPARTFPSHKESCAALNICDWSDTSCILFEPPNKPLCFDTSTWKDGKQKIDQCQCWHPGLCSENFFRFFIPKWTNFFRP